MAAPCSPAAARRDASVLPSPPATATKPEAWPSGRRLLRRADFRAAYEQGMRRASRHFTAFGRRRGLTGGVRFGITVSRKLGGAVVRNRIRRRTRELLRQMPESCLGCDVVINPRPAVASAEFLPLGRELGELIRRLCEALPPLEKVP